MADNVNIKVNIDTQGAEKSSNNLRQRMIELRKELQSLAMAGKENTAEFQRVQKEYANLVDMTGDLAQSTRALANDYFEAQAAMEGMSVGVNIFSGLAQATALLGVEDKDLQQTLVKLTAAQGLANTAMNIAKALNKDSSLMIALRSMATKTNTAEITKNTAATTAASAATTGFATSEGAATVAAGTLTTALKSVGAAMKSIPIIGWVAAAVGAVTTLITLIYDANKAEEDGNTLKERRIALLKQELELQSRLSASTSLAAVNLEQYGKIVSNIANKDTKEWANAVNVIASKTGLSAEYIKENAENIGSIIEQYNENIASQERLNKLIAHQNELDGKRNEILDASKKAHEDLIANQNKSANVVRHYQKAYEEAKAKEEEYFEDLRVTTSAVIQAQETVNKNQLNFNQYLADSEKLTKSINNTIKSTVKTTTKQIDDSSKEIFALLKFISDQEQHFNEQTTAGKLRNIDKEEETILSEYDTALDAAIKYYGAESEYAQKLLEMRLQALDELADKRRQLGREEVREAADREYNIIEARLNADLQYLPTTSKEYYDKKIQIDKAEEERELIELARLRQDNLVSLGEYQAQYDLIVAEHARNRKDIELEYTRQTLEEQQDMRDAQIEHTMNSFTAMSNYITALQDAELENVKGNEQEEANVRKRYARINFASQVASIGIDIAKGIMSVWSTAGEAGPILGPILGGIQTAFISATGLAQIAKAKAAMDEALSGKAARGGYIVGNSHANGGVKIEAEGGEAILNKRAMAIPAFRRLASDMNVATGGVSFANSSASSTLTASIDPNVVRQIVSEVVAIPVVVSEQRITEVQRDVDVIENRRLI